MATQIPTTQSMHGRAARMAQPRPQGLAGLATRSGIAPADPCLGAVIFDLGDWTKVVPKKGKVRVQFSLLRSRDPVVKITLELKLSSSPTWVPQDMIIGADLRPLSGVYFQMPAAPKRYDLRVIAQSAGGCTDPSNRPFSVEVV